MHDYDILIDAYIDNTITDDQFALLCDWLRQDTAHRQAFARKLAMHSAIADWCVERSGSSIAGDLSATQSEADEPQAASWMGQLSSLDAHPEQAAEQADAPDTKSRAAGELTTVLSYELRKALTSKPAYQVYAAATVVLVAATLLLAFAGGNEAPISLNDPAETSPLTSQPIVATLTAEHDAVWDRRPGQDLYPGQRFTLAQGFAEITTKDGAVAILEAPATVELLDNNNALRLHAGKLVGICQTESSKGFLVLTPSMDVTDLGTRFGVYATAIASEVHIFEGEIEVAGADLSDGRPSPAKKLTKGQAAHISNENPEIVVTTADASRFASTSPVTHRIPGTGVGLAPDENDVRWFVITQDGEKLEQPQPLTVSQAFGHVRYLPNDLETSQWLSWLPESEPTDQPTVAYRLRTQFNLPSTIDAATARLSMRYIADNQLRAVYLNGQKFSVDSDKATVELKKFQSLVLDEHLVAGENIIEFEVMNLTRRRDEPTREVGIRLLWEIQGQPNLFD